MGPKLPPALKPITPYIKRADELNKRSGGGGDKEAMMAYFCRSYAMQLGIPLNDGTPAVADALGALMTRLEQDKRAFPKYDRAEAREFCEKFALAAFREADAVDRAGRAVSEAL